MYYPQNTAPLATLNPVFGMGIGLGASGGNGSALPPTAMLWPDGSVMLWPDGTTMLWPS